MKTLLLCLTILLGIALSSEAKIRTETVSYTHGDAVFEGYLAYDDAVKTKRPGVLVIHEWWGLNNFIRGRVEELAKMGYVAFAVDMYGKDVRPKTAEEAGMLASMFRSNRKFMRTRADAGLAILRQHALVDPGRIAAIGYCFGGGVVLEMARGGADLAAVVSFHGNLDNPTPADAKNIKAKVLVLHGAADPFVKPDQVSAFWNEMNGTSADWQLIVYSGAVHSFTNPESGNDPSKGVAYNETAARRSWEAMKLLFSEIFKK